MTTMQDTHRQSAQREAVTVTVRVAGRATPMMRERLRRALSSLPAVVSLVDEPDGSGGGFVIKAGSLIELCAAIIDAPGLEQAEVSATPDGLEVTLPPDPVRTPQNGTSHANGVRPSVVQKNGVAASGVTHTAPMPPPSREAVAAPPVAGPATTVAGGRRYPVRRRGHGGTIAVSILAVVAVAAVAVVLIWRSRGSETPPPAPQPTVAAPPRILVVPRSLNSVCTMDGYTQGCDSIGQALWEGKTDAWQALARLEGRPAPNAQQAFNEATRFRLEMGDPVARIDLAKSLRMPATFITEVKLTRSAEGLAVEIQLSNLGASLDDLSGARLLDDQGMTVLALPDGSTLLTSSRCRLSAAPSPDTACSFVPVFGNRPAGAEIKSLELRNRDGELIDRLAIPGVP